MDLIVHPAWRRRGLGSALLSFLVDEAVASKAASLQARPYADGADALRLLHARGFRETMRMSGLVLDDVAGASLDSFESVESSLESRGIRITTLAAELQVDPAAWQKLRDANQAAQFGWPDPDPRADGKPHEPETTEQFRMRADTFGMIADACFVAVKGEEYVGYSALTVNDKEQTQAGSGGTAVRPEFRGLGVATALKVQCVRWGQANGVRRLATASGNPAMVRVNEKLGFRRTYEEVRVVTPLL